MGTILYIVISLDKYLGVFCKGIEVEVVVFDMMDPLFGLGYLWYGLIVVFLVILPGSVPNFGLLRIIREFSTYEVSNNPN